MTNIYKIYLLLIALCCISNFTFSQTNAIEIKFIGNCGLWLNDGSTNLYIDFPYKSGAFGYMTYNQLEIDSIQNNSFFLFTHKHADHYSKKILKQIKNKHNGNVYGNWNTEDFTTLNQSIPNFTIETFKTKHRFSFAHYSYLITWHGKRIFLSGDTESAEVIATVKDIDWAFVPYWIMLDAEEKDLKIDTEKYAIYHLYPNQKIANSSPDKVILLNKQGEVFNLQY